MKFQGEVAWKDKQGNAGIRFVEAAPRMKRNFNSGWSGSTSCTKADVGRQASDLRRQAFYFATTSLSEAVVPLRITAIEIGAGHRLEFHFRRMGRRQDLRSNRRACRPSRIKTVGGTVRRTPRLLRFPSPAPTAMPGRHRPWPCRSTQKATRPRAGSSHPPAARARALKSQTETRPGAARVPACRFLPSVPRARPVSAGSPAAPRGK